MAETVTLQIPEALYQRLAIAAGATRAILLLLCGGDKNTQNQDIIRAKNYWVDFQRRENANV